MSTANLGMSSHYIAKSNMTKEIIPLPEPRNEAIIQNLIGRKGKNLRAWEKKAGIKPFDIKVKRNEVHIVGTNEQVEKAKKILNEIVEKELKCQENAKDDKVVQLPPGKTGFIMGKDGNTIKQIENETKTTIDVKGNAAHIKGLLENQEKATTKILEILKKSSTSTEGKIKVNLPPNCGLGPIIGQRHCNITKIAEETDACVEVIENAIYVSGEPNNCKKAIIKIKSKAADICQRKPLPGQLNFIHMAQKCDYGLKSLDCPNPSWNGEKHYKVYRIDEDNEDELKPEKLDAKGLQEFLLKVLKEIQQEYEGKEEIKADFWCHFGHLYIGNIDEAEENKTYDIEQIRKELNRAKDPWKLRFDPATKELEIKGLEEVLKEKPYTVDPHIRHDFQFYTPNCTSIRAKIFVDMNGNLNSKFSAQDIDVRKHESASPTKYLLCDQFQTRAKVNIMILSEGMDCRLNIRTVSPNNQETKEFEKEITKYLDKISVVDKEVQLPDDSNMPEDYVLYYWRKCHRRSYQYEVKDVKYSVTISEEDIMDVTGSGQKESTKTDIHLHCDEWDRLLTSGKWEPEQIVEKVPQFLEFVRDVQRNVSPTVHAGSSHDILSLPSQSAKSSEECYHCGSEIFEKLKKRHAVVLETSCFSEMQIEKHRMQIPEHSLMEEAKNDPRIAKLGASEENITAYLKEAAMTNLHDNAQQIHSIIPYRYKKQIAIVIYTYDPTPDLINQEWSQRFLGFPVFIVNLMRGYAVEPAVLPDPYPAVPPEKREKYNTMKDDIIKDLAAKHSNLSSVSVDYRIRRNKLVAEVCLQIGVLTKGIVPLGEDLISPEINGVPVDIVEVSATLCVQPMILSVWPVKLGVGIGVEHDNTSTGSLGAVVKHDSGELFLLSNAHVLCRKGIESVAIVHPSQQNYEELQNNANKIEVAHKEQRDKLSFKIENKRCLGEDVTRLEGELNEKRGQWLRTKEQIKEDLKKKPRKIGTFTLRKENFTRQNNYECEASLRQTKKSYGVDAAIASIEKDEFDSQDMFEIYEWPDDLKDDDGNDVSKISLNGDFMKEKDGEIALHSEAVVYKCGRTTGVTRGTLFKEINVKVGCKESIFEPISKDQAAAAFPSREVSASKLKNEVWYNVLHIKSATVRSLGRGDFCKGGDSGAIVFDENGSCVGLLFGRVDSALYPMGGGLATPIHVVFEALNITLAKSDDL